MAKILLRRGGEMKAEDCRKLDTCDKIRMVMDKDLAEDRQYAVVIRRVCERCEEGEKKPDDGP
jgi:hypothetical protein